MGGSLWSQNRTRLSTQLVTLWTLHWADIPFPSHSGGSFPPTRHPRPRPLPVASRGRFRQSRAAAPLWANLPSREGGEVECGRECSTSCENYSPVTPRPRERSLAQGRKVFLLLFGGLLDPSMATHSSTLAWKIPWTEEPGRRQSMGSRRVGHLLSNFTSLFTFMYWRRNGNPLQCSCLENPRTAEPGGPPSMGSHRVGHD